MVNKQLGFTISRSGKIKFLWYMNRMHRGGRGLGQEHKVKD